MDVNLYVEFSLGDVIQTLPERHVARPTKIQTVPKNTEFDFSQVKDVTLITFLYQQETINLGSVCHKRQCNFHSK
jgi:hypothetical protein